MATTRWHGLRRLGSLIDRAAEPAFLLDADGRLAYVNPAWEGATGLTQDRALGLDCRLARRGDVSPELAGIAAALSPPPEVLDGQPAAARVRLPGTEGRTTRCLVTFWPFLGSGVLLGTLGLIRGDDQPSPASEAESIRLRAELVTLKERLDARYGFDLLIGQGPAHGRLLEQVRAAASSATTVLIVGEPGTGKRLVARTIHQRGPGADAPLVSFDCAAVPPDLLMRQMFRDAEGKSPRLDIPDGGSLLLESILDLPRDGQERLAGALDGPVRLLATTAADVDRALRDGRLRADLYYRITALVVTLRPLRERRDELPLLAQDLLERINTRGDRPRCGFSTEALAALMDYDWPGNWPELARVIEAAHRTATGDLIAIDATPASIRGHLGAAHMPPPGPSPIAPLDATLSRVERRLIERALRQARRNKSRAAELLQISRPRLHRRIVELGIESGGDRPDPQPEMTTPDP